MEEQKILLSDVFTALLQFKSQPTKENQKKIDDLMQSFKIKTYMPMYEKKVIAAMILNSVLGKDSNTDSLDYSIALEVNKIIYGLLGYVYNLKNDLIHFADDLDICYDSLYEFGIVDYIKKYCKEDFEKLSKIIDDSLNFENVDRMSSLGNLLNSEEINHFTDTIKTMKKELTPERVENLKSVLNAEAPEWQAFKETIGDAALDAMVNRPAEKKLEETTNDKK